MAPTPMLLPPHRHCRGRVDAGWHARSALAQSPPLCPAAARPHTLLLLLCMLLLRAPPHPPALPPTTTGAPTHARRNARSSSARLLTSSAPSSQCSPTRSHRRCAPCAPFPPPSTPMCTCPLDPHSACAAEPTKSCRARMHVPRLTHCVPRHERRLICQCSVLSSCSPASRRL